MTPDVHTRHRQTRLIHLQTESRWLPVGEPDDLLDRLERLSTWIGVGVLVLTCLVVARQGARWGWGW